MNRSLLIPLILGIIIIFHVIRLTIRSSTHHFSCSECGENFQVSFFNYTFTAHSLDGKCSVKCPKCGKTNMLKPLKGKK
ncbi:hypothetical protein bsdtw1_02742 [Clostridium fungisolvens]|uniref:Uncharacterized protein n=1 Tax=Clostridium fungisolvens TaxID=1604897 RepID=A0A6V8SHF3_9CLOT|nr:hypothetical protein bsdtw1_02742 [Clostridium fungisolvens]